jgi:hypothetical protein
MVQQVANTPQNIQYVIKYQDMTLRMYQNGTTIPALDIFLDLADGSPENRQNVLNILHNAPSIIRENARLFFPTIVWI